MVMYADDIPLYCNIDSGHKYNEKREKIIRWLAVDKLSLYVGKQNICYFLQLEI